MIRSIVVLALLGLTALAAESIAQNRPLTALQAIESAKKALGRDWHVAFISNTGVTSSATSDRLSGPADALMQPDGRAGQWVVELFKDSPKPVVEGGRKGKAYPFRQVIVTAHGASELPDQELTVPNVLPPLKSQCLQAIDAARALALSKMKVRFDVLSVASDVRSNGDCSWKFRFYDLKKDAVVGAVHVSGDGKRVLGK